MSLENQDRAIGEAIESWRAHDALNQATTEALEKARRTQGTILNDLEAALNLVRHYQRLIQHMGGVPDPKIVEARNLLTKYNMPQGYTKDQPFAIISEGKDISTYPDSIEGSTAEVEEIEMGECECRLGNCPPQNCWDCTANHPKKELPSGNDGNT